MTLATISIVGNLAKDPELHKFDNGRSKTTLFVAVNSFNKTKMEKRTDYYRVETWDRLAESAKIYLHKGNQVAVSGKIALEKWIDREGKTRITPTVIANQLAFPPRSGSTSSAPPAAAYKNATSAPAASRPELRTVSAEPEIDEGPPPNFDVSAEEVEAACSTYAEEPGEEAIPEDIDESLD